MTGVTSPPLSQFTNLQWQLLQLYNRNVSEEKLLEIKQLLSNYFAEKAASAMDNLWEEKGWTDQTMLDWLDEDVHQKDSNK
jgi:hypothetical protein